MTNSSSSNHNPNRTINSRQMSPEYYARLKAEAKAPYRLLRQFIYLAFGASGCIGAFVFLAQLATGHNLATTIPNFALQIGIVALMIWLFRLDQPTARKP